MCLGVFQIAAFCLFRVTCRPRGAQCIWGLPQPALLTCKLPNFRVLVLGRLAPVLWERFSLCCDRCRFGTEGQSHQSHKGVGFGASLLCSVVVSCPQDVSLHLRSGAEEMVPTSSSVSTEAMPRLTDVFQNKPAVSPCPLR